VDLGHGRLGHLLQQVPGLEDRAAEAAQGRGLGGELPEGADVHPAGEHRPRAPQHQRLDLRIGRGCGEGLAEGLDELPVERVALLGTVEDDVADGAAVLRDDDRHARQHYAGRVAAMPDRPAPPVLWEPSPEAARATALWRFLEAQGLDPADYAAAWAWSVADLDRFWRAVSDFFALAWDAEPEAFLADERMPGAVWCPGGTLPTPSTCSRARARTTTRSPSSTARSRATPGSWTWGELRAQVARVRAGLQALGVGQG
jgi:hypothetical protein